VAFAIIISKLSSCAKVSERGFFPTIEMRSSPSDRERPACDSLISLLSHS
jgi:hypothetical protein